MVANKENFYTATIANFKGVKTPTRKCDFESNSGSKYWYTEKGVIRQSNHWNEYVATCSWLLNNQDCDELKTGFCKWEDFKLKDISVTVYVKNHEVFNNFKYDGFDYSGKGYFTFKPSFENIKNNVINFYGRTCVYVPNYFLSIKFDF